VNAAGQDRKRRAAQEMEASAARKARRKAAAAAWGSGDADTRQRTAMVIAAFLLDDARDPELADWLLCARPDAAKMVATGVAALALRNGLTAVWDALAAVRAMDIKQASEWYETEGVFVWSPDSSWLCDDLTDREASDG
jgi:hypothetical protein